MPPKKTTKKVAKKSKRVYKKRVYKKKSNNVPEYASLSVKRTLQTGGANFQVNQLYNLMNTQLIDYQRAVQVAQAYQHYRIKNIKLTFKPTFDTFSQNGAQTMSKMHLYFMLDKSGTLPTNITLEGLKQLGARPFTLDEKEKVVSWAPTVLESTMYAPPVASSPSKYRTSPWLSTNANIVSPNVFVASGVDHLGIYWYCEQLITPGATAYEVEVEVQFQFKKPLAANITGDHHAIPVQVAELNSSKDGIVGGADGV